MSGQQSTAVATAEAQRRRVTVRGVVQGVGFRPFVYALARELGLAGHVTNTGDGVVAEVEGAPGAVAGLLRADRLRGAAPGRGGVRDPPPMPAAGATGFTIAPPVPAPPGPHPGLPRHGHLRGLPGRARRPRGPPLPAPVHQLHALRAALHDRDRPAVRPPAHHDGPLPDVPRLRAEYADPADRRFHAQTVSCHDCGPRLRLVVAAGSGDGRGDGATGRRARRLLAGGRVLAVKGLGGYHLACDADEEDGGRGRCGSARRAATSRSR